MTKNTRNPTFWDLHNSLKQDGTYDRDIVELVLQANEALFRYAVVKEASGENDKTTIRTGLPDATWTAYFEGVQPSKGEKKQISNAPGRLKALLQADKDQIKDSPNGAEEMLDQAFAHAESMGNEVAEAIMYGNIKHNAKAFNGLAPIYSAHGGLDRLLSSHYCIESLARSATPDNSALRSIFLVGWGRQGAYLFYPRGTKSGMERGPLKDQTLSEADGSRREVMEQFFTWNVGLTVKDFRYCGRICNIESNNLKTLDKDIGEDMQRLMIRTKSNGARRVFYMSAAVYEWLAVKTRRQVLNTTFSSKDVGGEEILHFNGIPVHTLDCLDVNEEPVPQAS